MYMASIHIVTEADLRFKFGYATSDMNRMWEEYGSEMCACKITYT